MEGAMTDPVMSNLPLRRVLTCISERGKSEREIAKDFTQKYPPDIELFINLLQKAREKAFNEVPKEREVPSVQWQLDHLLAVGYIEVEPKDFHEGKDLLEETNFYNLSPRGRTALLSAYGKKTRL